MRLDAIEIRNYRCFEEIKINLHPKLTVLVAENGVGKTTVLDALRVALWPFINSFDLAQSGVTNDPANTIAIDDVRQITSNFGGMSRQLPVKVTAHGDWGRGCADTWTRRRESERPKTWTMDDDQVKEMKRWATDLQDKIRLTEGQAKTVPMFGYYGTGRLWAQKNLTKSKKGEKDDSDDQDFYVRTFAYRNCMDPASSYKHFREWFIWAWTGYANMQVQQHVSDADKQMALDRIRVVQNVIDVFVKEATGWGTLEYSVINQKALVLNHPEHGMMPVEMLSDGIRSMLAMVGDIAHRCVKLNPHLGQSAAQETPGVVLIDEVDMHLHPRWQQLVLTQLQEAFKNIQFVVTTHSPQVLTATKPECIRALRWMSDPEEAQSSETDQPRNVDPLQCHRVTVFEEFDFSEGAESQQLLKDILGVDSRPEQLPIVQKLHEYLSLIEADQWDTDHAKALQTELKAWGSDHEAALVRADMDIRMRQYRRQPSQL